MSLVKFLIVTNYHTDGQLAEVSYITENIQCSCASRLVSIHC